ncbi:DNA-3-methyladenine glycosylase family protein [Paenibacillus sp. UNC451MF]|uniref:DNA-3-methyladenine glycosylase family protein n=1 Tax=Paenibacillus sp. UNC451MF TaxID=1449063 RepID=UPI0009DEA2ED|nr:DNA-3-methyladenine glycosylase [Paenibacillus sp. UNC451MF]
MNADHIQLPGEHWTDHEDHILMTPPSVFSFEHNLGYLKRSSNECMFHVDGNAIYKLIPVENNQVLAQITSTEDNTLKIRFLGEADFPSPSERAAAASYVWEWFDLSTQLESFYQIAKQDALLSTVVEQFHGLRILGIPDLFEALCWGILGQQINLAFAYTLKRRVVEAFGQSVTWNGQAFWLFPTPETMAALSVADLTPLQLTGKKAEYLIGVAKLIAEGQLSKEMLLQLQDPKAIEKRLVQIRGIGPWTANYVLMRCLKAPSAFPIEDVGLHNAIKQLLDMQAKPSLEELKQLSAPWGDWKAYATFYLWRTIY